MTDIAWSVIPKVTPANWRGEQRPLITLSYEHKSSPNLVMHLYLNRPAIRILQEKKVYAFDIVVGEEAWGLRPNSEGAYRLTDRLAHYGVSQLAGLVKPGHYLMEETPSGVLKAVFLSSWLSRKERRAQKEQD